ncbi:MAG: S8 family serine peptidase, partial [bacterium]
MNRIVFALFVLASFSTAWPDLARPPVLLADGTECLPGQAIVTLAPGLRGRLDIADDLPAARFGVESLDRLNRRFGVTGITPLMRRPADAVAEKHNCDLQYLIEAGPGVDVGELTAAYAGLPEVASAVPNAFLRFTRHPDDTLYRVQWHLARIGAPWGWDVARGDTTVLIAVLDDGCEWHHPDIEPNLWINHPEDRNGNGRFDSLPWPDGDIDGIDQDGNGYADDVIGFDFAYGDPNPDPGQLSDDHGTHCWGTANAVTNNSIGVAAPPWNARSFGFRCGGGGGISLYAAIAGIYYSVPKGVFAISMSFGGYSPYQPLADACQYAWDSGCVLIGGAGNDGQNRIFYPANYPSVISVAASGPNDTKTSWSNYGDWIEITAPGSGIYSTITGHRYGSMDGTSMSTPLIAGVLAWIKSLYPDYTNAQCCSLMYATCDTMPDPLFPQGNLGAGRVSMANVVLPLYYCNLTLTGVRWNDASGNNNGRPDPGETASLIVTYANTAGWQNATGVTATLACRDPEVQLLKSTAGFPAIPAGGSGNCSGDSFVVRVPANSPPQMQKFLLTVSAEPDPAYPDTNFTVQSGDPRVLLVDDDLGLDYEKWYRAAC